MIDGHVSHLAELSTPSSPNAYHALVSSTPAADVLRLREHLEHDTNKMCGDLGEASEIVVDGVTDLEQECNNPTLDCGASSDKIPISQGEGESERSAVVSQTETVDDLIRTIDIIKPADYESTYRAKMLIDSGNPHENLISRKLVDALCLPRSQKKPSFLRRVLNKLAPCTKVAIVAKEQAKGRVRSIDGTVIDGQDGTVTISWYGKNRSGLTDPILYFQPKRYETTHIIVDSDRFGADIILSWKEVKHLKLRRRFTGAIQRPPTPKTDPGDKKYQDYEQRRADKKVTRDEKRGNGQVQPPTANGTSQRTQ